MIVGTRVRICHLPVYATLEGEHGHLERLYGRNWEMHIEPCIECPSGAWVEVVLEASEPAPLEDEDVIFEDKDLNPWSRFIPPQEPTAGAASAARREIDG